MAMTDRPTWAPLTTGVIDCDIHPSMHSVEVLVPYLAEHWRAYIRVSAFKGPVVTSYPRNMPTSAQPSTKPPSGGPPGSDPKVVCQQTLDALNATYGILNCDYAVQTVHNPDFSAALASAVNDWLSAEWLTRDSRLRASLVVSTQHPDLAVREIERVGDLSGFVQVYLPVHSSIPYGNRYYWPIYEAASRHDLAIGIHFGGAAGHPFTPVGWPSYYIEEYVGMAQAFQTQLVSLVCEGVFDQFPTLRVALIESGFTWLPSLMWRLDKDWKALRREVPWVRMLPSEYIREHVRLTIQPQDAPAEPRWLIETIEELGSDELLMFSTDHPHWHFETHEEAIPQGLSDAVRQRVLVENARAFYRLQTVD